MPDPAPEPAPFDPADRGAGGAARRVVGHSVNPFLFGTGSWVYGQVRGLSRWRAEVVCKRREHTETFPFEPVHARDDLPLLEQLVQRAGRSRRGYHPFHREALERAGCRLLHSHFATQGWTDLPLARDLGLPHVTSFYGADIWKNSRHASWRERFAELFERGALFLVEGHAMRAKVESLGCPPGKVREQHLGVALDPSQFRLRAPGPDGQVRFLAAGRAVEKKGFEPGLRAFAHAHRQNPALRLTLMLIARSKAERERVRRLEELVRTQGLAGAVDFARPLPYDEYRRALAAYHVFLAPSHHAANGDAEGGAPVSLIEMSAAGMPIVASDHCDIPEVVVHGQSGLVVPEGDVGALVDAILFMAESPERWPAFGRAGRAHVEREYDLATQVASLESIYDELV
jgi:colanic acid/amylovoran biosynthesis glycosyltransferase